jgi:hypothetical protein
MEVARYDAAMGEASATVSEGVVEGDMPCAQCGYNLRTLSASGVCPECGTPVTETRRREKALAIFSFRRMAWGATLLTLLAACGAIEALWFLYTKPIFAASEEASPFEKSLMIVLPWIQALYRVPLVIAALLVIASRRRAASARLKRVAWWVAVLTAVAGLLIVAAAYRVTDLAWIRAISLPPLFALGVWAVASCYTRASQNGRERRFVWITLWIACLCAGALAANIGWLLSNRLSTRPTTGWAIFNVEFVHLDIKLVDPWPFWINFTDPLISICCLWLLVAGARLVRRFLGCCGRPRLAWWLALFFLPATIFPAAMISTLLLFYLDFKAGAGRFIQLFISRHIDYLYLLFYAPMLVCWGVVAVVAWRERRRRRGVTG